MKCGDALLPLCRPSELSQSLIRKQTIEVCECPTVTPEEGTAELGLPVRSVADAVDVCARAVAQLDLRAVLRVLELLHDLGVETRRAQVFQRLFATQQRREIGQVAGFQGSDDALRGRALRPRELRVARDGAQVRLR